jgi:hypothetical protein
MGATINSSLDAEDLIAVRIVNEREVQAEITRFLVEEGVGSYRKVSLIRPASGEIKGGTYYLFNDEQTAFWFKMKFG